MTFEFTVAGEPKAKGRPRFNPRYAGSRPRTPEDTVAYENLIGWEFRRQCRGTFPEKVPVEMEIRAYYTIPASASKTRKTLMEQGQIRPTKKPDLDNVVKVYADALNHVAYHDDAQVIKISCEKYYSHEPRVEVRLNNLKEDMQDEDRKK